jgi:hypothetical protein
MAGSFKLVLYLATNQKDQLSFGDASLELPQTILLDVIPRKQRFSIFRPRHWRRPFQLYGPNKCTHCYRELLASSGDTGWNCSTRVIPEPEARESASEKNRGMHMSEPKNPRCKPALFAQREKFGSSFSKLPLPPLVCAERRLL